MEETKRHYPEGWNIECHISICSRCEMCGMLRFLLRQPWCMKSCEKVRQFFYFLGYVYGTRFNTGLLRSSSQSGWYLIMKWKLYNKIEPKTCSLTWPTSFRYFLINSKVTVFDVFKRRDFNEKCFYIEWILMRLLV